MFHNCAVIWYINLWHDHIDRNVATVDGTGNELLTYSSLKHSFSLENYISQMNLEDRRNLRKLRISCHDLAIETDRYANNRKPLAERICIFEDKYHLFMVCPLYKDERKYYFSCRNSFSSVIFATSREDFIILMQCTSSGLDFTKATCKFINTYCAKRKWCVGG